MSLPLYFLISPDEIKDLLTKAADTGPNAADDFFGKFNYVPEILSGDASLGKRIAFELLNTCIRVDPSAYARIHKGTPYYWLGTAACRLEDYESALFFFAAAASEDIKQGANAQSDATPTFLFMTVEGGNPNQAAQRIVRAAQDRVDEVIRYYNSLTPISSQGPLTIDDIRGHLLRPALDPSRKSLRSIATPFISFLLEWDYRNSLFDVILDLATLEPFFAHLLKGCVLFESLLKANPKAPITGTGLTLGAALSVVYSALGFSTIPNIHEADFSNILQVLQPVLGGSKLSAYQVVELTGKIRNTLGHNLGWDVQINKLQYHHLFRIVAASCLHAIACLYR